MENNLKAVFKKMHLKIINSISEPDSVIDDLFSKNVISDDDYHEIRQRPTESDRCRDLLSLLHVSEHTKAFSHLRLALQKKNPGIVMEVDCRLWRGNFTDDNRTISSLSH